MVYHWSLSDSKSPQVSKTLLSILVVLNNAIIWMVSTRPVISKSSSPCTNPFGHCTTSTNYNWYNRHFHVLQVFQFPCKVDVLIPLFAFIQFYSVVLRDSKVHSSASSLLIVDYHMIWSSSQD